MPAGLLTPKETKKTIEVDGNPPGMTGLTSTVVTFNNDNVTIEGWDFSGRSVQIGGANCKLIDCYIGSSPTVPLRDQTIRIEGSAADLLIAFNEIEGHEGKDNAGSLMSWLGTVGTPTTTGRAQRTRVIGNKLHKASNDLVKPRGGHDCLMMWNIFGPMYQYAPGTHKYSALYSPATFPLGQLVVRGDSIHQAAVEGASNDDWPGNYVSNASWTFIENNPHSDLFQGWNGGAMAVVSNLFDVDIGAENPGAAINDLLRMQRDGSGTGYCGPFWLAGNWFRKGPNATANDAAGNLPKSTNAAVSLGDSKPTNAAGPYYAWGNRLLLTNDGNRFGGPTNNPEALQWGENWDELDTSFSPLAKNDPAFRSYSRALPPPIPANLGMASIPTSAPLLIDRGDPIVTDNGATVTVDLQTNWPGVGNDPMDFDYCIMTIDGQDDGDWDSQVPHVITKAGAAQQVDYEFRSFNASGQVTTSTKTVIVPAA